MWECYGWYESLIDYANTYNQVKNVLHVWVEVQSLRLDTPVIEMIIDTFYISYHPLFII